MIFKVIFKYKIKKKRKKKRINKKEIERHRPPRIFLKIVGLIE